MSNLTGARKQSTQKSLRNAQVVKLVDTPASGAGPRKGVEVQVLSWAPLRLRIKFGRTNHLFLKTLSGT